MTRRAPWVVDDAQGNSAATQSQIIEPEYLAQTYSNDDGQKAATLEHADSAITKHYAPKHATASAPSLAYVPPNVKEEDTAAEALHLHHPDEETRANIEAQEQAQARANTSKGQEPVSNITATHIQDESDDESDAGQDLLETLGDFLTGGRPPTADRSRSRDQALNPFSFLDALGEALVAPFLGEQNRHDARAARNETLPQTTRSEPPPAIVKPAGNFHMSSKHVSLIEGRYLVASCKSIAGTWERSRFDLDECLMNDNGSFKWSAEGGFSRSARHAALSQDGELLRAQLKDTRGLWVDARVRLGNVITNGNGKLATIPQDQWH